MDGVELATDLGILPVKNISLFIWLKYMYFLYFYLLKIKYKFYIKNYIIFFIVNYCVKFKRTYILDQKEGIFNILPLGI